MGVDLKINKTKILVTVGPSVSSAAKIDKLVKLGVRGFRQNFSHGTNEERAGEIKWVRESAKKHGVNVAIIQDLQGPKLRLGKIVNNHMVVKKGDELGLTHGIEHDGGPNLPVQHDLSKIVRAGDDVFLFDGMIGAKVVDVVGKIVRIKIENDGFLMSNKSINLPDADLKGDVFTEKDIKDIKWGVKQDYDYVAMSFVQTASDVEQLRKMLQAQKSDAKIITKVETKSATAAENLEEIVAASDGVMVARGDMATEVGEEKVPVIQEEIIEFCEKYGKFSIVATQMLESMVENPHPTRAEVSDIATAAMEGADTVMLSDETANGKYPLEAVEVMQKTIAFSQTAMPPLRLTDTCRVVDARRDHIAIEAVDLLHSEQADVILVETKSGKTVESVALRRPEKPILAVTDDVRVANQLSLWYGAEPVVVDDTRERDYGLRWLKASGLRHKHVIFVNATGGDAVDTVRSVEI
ncbi:MAG: pyruvate kinase [Candidatus Nomurabacteria bacterium]|jgi:pyruvate kinase|nr:pyruvate kinase [Candidatus Nomurabacteria bacterium]